MSRSVAEGGYRGLAPDVLRWFYLVPFDVLAVSLAPFTACAEVAVLARFLFFPVLCCVAMKNKRRRLLRVVCECRLCALVWVRLR